MIELTTPTGQRIRVADDRVDFWEARGYKRANQEADTAPKSTKKATTRKKSSSSKSKK